MIIRATAADAGRRVDQWLEGRLNGLSRTRIQALIRGGHIAVDRRAVKAHARVREGMEAEIQLPPPERVSVEAENIPLDILYEDADILVLNKPAGLVVHPAAGHRAGTLVNALLFHCHDLTGIGGELRPGLVHRLDKDTSGALVVAKNDMAMAGLVSQFKEGRVRKEYVAFVHGTPKPPEGRIETLIGRSPRDRKKMSAQPRSGRRAVTHYRVDAVYGDISRVHVRIETGRTHQIRVHMAHLGHPVVGDIQYGRRKASLQAGRVARQMLHAERLGLTHPRTGRQMQFVAPLPPDMRGVLELLSKTDLDKTQSFLGHSACPLAATPPQGDNEGDKTMPKLTHDDLQLTANTIRGLAMDGVQKAKSGHPGMPMGMADVASVLWLKHLEHCPSRPDWADRDRFILSAGHGSMLLYSLLHLSGYDVPVEELMRFRQWESKTPGHPEHGVTPGVETTTGPLGQGCGNGVGMALAERMLAERFNTAEFTLVDHFTYVLCGDGDLMEGVSHEAFSLAGHLGLNKLIVFYDSNRISIEGSTDLAYSDDVKKRFQGYRWSVIEVDAHNCAEADRAVRRARREKERPTLIICHSHIAQGSPNKHDTAGAHGEPLGDDEIKAAKRGLGMDENAFFAVPSRVREQFAARLRKMQRLAARWDREFARYAAANPDRAAEWKRFMSGEIPDNLAAALPVFPSDKPVASRVASGRVIQELAKVIPNLVGGSADLAPSTKTLIDGAGHINRGAFAGRNFHFGVREHGMAAILNGLALHGGFHVYGATFFVFLDYCRPSVRLAAIMGLPVIYVFTHDSFYVGEDGPTHEPVEQLASLRCMPGVTVIRPADPTETGAAWVAAIKNSQGPTALLLSRQDLPVLDRGIFPPAAMVEKGGYTLWQSREGVPQFILLASGSEVDLALRTAKALAAELIVRVVSLPSWELFERQPESYRQDVLPPQCSARLAIEAGSSFGWNKYTGSRGRTLCLDRYGASAPYKVLAEKFGFTVENAVAIVREMLR